ncbi:hypothetical protein KKC08_05100 [Patescibacteria group bacterium]|nr:hypothetical protein [Patescibacteria group bacterium]MCG2701746.1 hypothetical protein [Candidatus Parcubacteria bacterium]MBU4264651.1 hypothetical protein [Patescibacteria group bacterium]MBU4390606.1 hypothetical protein [Patescibacteria group bacterium]MBU4397514.1 hypothetical protein [Patescibacteria group bacterium]
MKCKKNIKGKRCQANAMKDSDYCYFHNPDITANEKRSVQVKGGQNRRVVVSSPLPQIKIEKVEDVTKLLVDTINEVRDGRLDCRVANTIGFLTGMVLKSFEVSVLEKRIDKIELTVNS